MRIVLTVVGVSLVDEFLQLNLRDLAKGLGLYDDRDLRDAEKDVAELRSRLRRLKSAKERPHPDQTGIAYWRDDFSEIERLAEILRALWRSASDEKLVYGPAEFASLSLLKPPLAAGDQVWLLSSDTEIGAFCTAVLGDVLGNPGSDSSLCAEGVIVRPVLLQGVQMWDSNRLAQDGFSSWATAIKDAQDLAKNSGNEVILNITGGFKGVAPLGALLAMGLSRTGKRIGVVYRYEDTVDLFELPGTDLVSFDLSLFDCYQKDWGRLSQASLPLSDAKRTLSAPFYEKVIEGHLGLVSEKNNPSRFEISPLGRLLLALWYARPNDEAPAAPHGGV